MSAANYAQLNNECTIDLSITTGSGAKPLADLSRIEVATGRAIGRTRVQTDQLLANMNTWNDFDQFRESLGETAIAIVTHIGYSVTCLV